jgi:hypothetical protein
MSWSLLLGDIVHPHRRLLGVARANTSAGESPEPYLLHQVVGGSTTAVAMVCDQLWQCGLIPPFALVGVSKV